MRTDNHTILVVDDEAANLRHVSECLRTLGCRILVARNGPSALEKAQYGQPDLILLDVMMPGMDGFETCRRLKADEALRDIPIIFMSSLTETEDKVKGFQVGAVDYITKPFQHEEVLARLTTHLRLRDLARELQEAKETLEKQVEERTAELAQTNRELLAEITERKWVEEALRESEERYRSLFEGVPVGIYRTAAAGQILDANPTFVRMLNYPDQETLLAENSADFYVNPKIRQEWQAMVEREGVVRDFETQVRRRDGTVIWVKDTGRVVRDVEAQVLYYEGSLEDITERKHVEQEKEMLQAQMAHTQKMEALGQLAGGIAHDFNNLLTVIQLNTQLMKRQLSNQDPLGKHVREIEETSERATKLIRQLLSFGRREITEPRVLDLNDIICDLAPMVRRIVGEKIELKIAMVEDLWPVKADPSQMEQVLVNLVVNARDAMPQGGILTVETNNVVLDETYTALHVEAQSGEHMLLTISDTGVGMSAEVKTRIFEPFFTTKEPGRGTGLGLAIVFGIVKQNGGHIQVDSQVGQGTTFEIYLPRG